jgi:hypothetical protein
MNKAGYTENIHCRRCKKATPHRFLGNREMTEDESRAMMASSRGIRSEYHTVECIICGYKAEYDFSKD